MRTSLIAVQCNMWFVLGSKMLRLDIFKLTQMEKNTKQLGGKFVVSKGWTYLKYERFFRPRETLRRLY